jgi:hypothetical protein
MSRKETPTQYPSGFYAPCPSRTAGSASTTPGMQSYSYRNSHLSSPYSLPSGDCSSSVGTSTLTTGFQDTYHPSAHRHHQTDHVNSRNHLFPALPNNHFKCEPCNHVVESKAALQAHTASHTSCTACTFSAAPKIVKAHFAAAHGKFSHAGFKSVAIALPGCPVQRFNICVGNRPEDVEKWIAERKRKFPRQKPLVPTKRDNRGLSNLLDGYGSSSSEKCEDNDEATAAEQDDTTTSESVNKKIKLSETSNDATCIAMDQKGNEQGARYRARPCRYFMRNGTCRNGASCKFGHDGTAHADSSSAPRNRETPTAKQTVATASQRTAPSLLQKLLTKDAQRETALALQLVDYIVESDFLAHARDESATEEYESSSSF